MQLERDGMLSPLTSSTRFATYSSVRGVSLWSTSPTPIYHATLNAILPQKGSIALSTRMDGGSWKGDYVNGRILSQWPGSQLMFLRTIDWNAGLARGMVYVELRTNTARTVQSATNH